VVLFHIMNIISKADRARHQLTVNAVYEIDRICKGLRSTSNLQKVRERLEILSYELMMATDTEIFSDEEVLEYAVFDDDDAPLGLPYSGEPPAITVVER
jgi:hypothetical protein